MSNGSASPRTPVLAGNWKMFKTVVETVQFLKAFQPLVADVRDAEIVIAPPFLSLPAAVEMAAGSNVQIGAQNLHWEKEGAYTGEVSAPMLRAAGCSHVIIGHSERRQYFHETDETVLKRVAAALAAQLTPIVCVGETLEQRQAKTTKVVCLQQFDGSLASLTEDLFSRIIVAYEPVWAIGTGHTATPNVAAEAHSFIRERARERFGSELAERLRLLYGGSVKPENAADLMAQAQIDGALVGGASLDPDSMAAIVKARA